MMEKNDLHQVELDAMIECHQKWLAVRSDPLAMLPSERVALRLNLRNRKSVGPLSFAHVDLSYAYISGCVLQGADFSNSKLEDTDLSFSDLRGAKFMHEMHHTTTLIRCLMSWDAAPWLINHPDFKRITFV